MVNVDLADMYKLLYTFSSVLDVGNTVNFILLIPTPVPNQSETPLL